MSQSEDVKSSVVLTGQNSAPEEFKTIEGYPIPNHLGVYYNERKKVLVQREIESIKVEPDQSLRLPNDGLFNRILFTDFESKLNYTLNCNGTHITGSHYSSEDECQVIDFTDLTEGAKIMLRLAIGSDEPTIPPYQRHLYLNATRINVVAVYPSHGAIKKRLLKPVQTVTIEGYFRTVDGWVKESRSYKLYPYSTYRLPLNYYTDSLMIRINADQKIELWTDDVKYGDYRSNELIQLDNVDVNKLYEIPDGCLPKEVVCVNLNAVSYMRVILDPTDVKTLGDFIIVKQNIYRCYRIHDNDRTNLGVYRISLFN